MKLRSSLRQHTRLLGVLLVTWLLLSTCSMLAQSPVSNDSERLINAGNLSRLEKQLQDQIAEHPTDASAHVRLGEVLALQGQRSGAIREMGQAIKLNPRSPVIYDDLGVVLMRFVEPAAARNAFLQAIALRPKFVNAHVHLALALKQLGDPTGVEKQLKIALRLEPKGPSAPLCHYLLGRLYDSHDLESKAQTEFDSAVILRQGYAEAWFASGMLNRKLDHQSAALDAFERAAKLDSANPQYQYELGSEYLEQRDYAEATAHLREAAAKMHPASIAVLYKLDRALRLTGNREQARRVQTQVQALLAKGDEVGRDSLKAEGLDNEGVALEREGKLSLAAEKYRLALELNPTQSGFRLNYALALCRLGHWSEGIAELQEILRTDPGNAGALRALYIAKDKAGRQGTVSEDK